MNHLILEKAFQQSVTDLASLTGWLVYHTHDSRRSSPGFPDLVMVRGSSLVFIELKKMGGRLSKEQADWLEHLSKVETVSTHLWKPSDWQTIERLLKNG